MNNPTYNTDKVWFITGASSGFGEEQAKLLLNMGYKVVTTSRDKNDVQHFADNYPDRALSLSLDVLKEQQIVDAVEAAKNKFGRIDVLMNNAGFGSFGTVEEFSLEEARNQFDVNFFGLIRMTQEVLPLMRNQQSGTILNISSVAGRLAFPAFGLYAASKHALEGMSKGLAAEVKSFGINVILIEPGIFLTDFGGRSLNETERKMDAYAEVRQQVMDNISGAYDEENFDENHGDPAKAAEAMLKIAETKNPPQFLALGIDAFENIGKQLDLQRKELNEWESLTKATAYKSKVEILEGTLATA